MRNKSTILIIVLLSVLPGNLISQDSINISTVVGTFRTDNKTLIMYSNYLEEMDKTDMNSLKLALDYFEAQIENKENDIRDIAALLFQKYYLSFTTIYLNNQDEPITYESVGNENIDKIQTKLNHFGLTLGKISDGEFLYILPTDGFLSEVFEKKVSASILEYFKLYGLTIRLRKVQTDSDSLIQYISLLEELILQAESYLQTKTFPIGKDYLNRFYLTYLVEYISIASNYGIKPELETEHNTKKLIQFYQDFASKNADKISGRFMNKFNELIDNNGSIPDLGDFFLTSEYNEFGILEIKRELKINTILEDLDIFLSE